jgi:hypothetical protein
VVGSCRCINVIADGRVTALVADASASLRLPPTPRPSPRTSGAAAMDGGPSQAEERRRMVLTEQAWGGD